MLGTTVLEGMGEEELLAFAGACAETERDAQIGQLRAAYQWAIMHPPERLDPEESQKPGREKARRYGGDGTPEVCEFAAAELGARLGVSTGAAAKLMADSLDLHHRGGALWDRVQKGEVKASYARHVVNKTRSLPPEQAMAVANRVATAADGRIPWTRFEKKVEAEVAKADPQAAREREARARNATFAKKLRADAFGMASFLIRAPLPVIDQIAANHAAYSAAIDEQFPELSDDQRDVQAIVMLLTPGSDQDAATVFEAAPVVNLYVHTYAGDDATGMARIEGHGGGGMVTEDYVRDLLGPLCRFKIYPVLDIEGMAPVDAYEIPDRHRQAVQILTPADTFPYGACLDHEVMQDDHTIPWVPHGPPGQSAIGNYGPMTTTHHRIKTHGRWQVQQPFPGIYVWRDQYGATYLVDNTGTRRLPEAGDALPMVVEIYRDLPAIEVDWEAA